LQGFFVSFQAAPLDGVTLKTFDYILREFEKRFLSLYPEGIYL
jgi:hypothetical protein